MLLSVETAGFMIRVGREENNKVGKYFWGMGEGKGKEEKEHGNKLDGGEWKQ